MESDACSRISHFSDRVSGMPICWNPTVTLLQKKREGLLNCDSPMELEVDENKSLKTNGTKMSDAPTNLLCHTYDGEKEEQQDSEDKQTTGHCEVTSKKQQVVQAASEKHAKSSKENDVYSLNTDFDNRSRAAVNVTKKKTNKNDKSWFPPHASYRLKRYQNQPMKIENYEPGMSSVVLRDPFVDNFYNPPVEKPGEFCKYVECSPEVRYEIHKANETVLPSLSETSVHDAYRKVQKGGDIPLEGLRCPIPPVKVHACHRVQKLHVKHVPHSSQNQSSQNHSSRYQNSHSQSLQVTQNSHMSADSALSWSLSMPETSRAHSASASSSCNIAQSRRARDELSAVRKWELEIAIAEARRKRLIEEAENNRARRHSDYFQPHAKLPVAPNRYDTDDAILHPLSLPTSPSSFDRRLVKARVLYTFKVQTNRELSLNKGDTVYILRQIDKNWFEGQHHGSVGIFPVSYVEVLEICQEQSFRDRENFAIAKYDFEAEYPVELSFQKGDVLRLIQVVDSNWYEASLGNRCGLVPKSYMETRHNHLYMPLTLPLTTSTSYTDSPPCVSDSPGTMSSTSSCLSSGLDPPIVSASESCQSQPLRCPDWNTLWPMSKTNHLAVDHDVHRRSTKNHPEPVKLFRRRSNSLSVMDIGSDESKNHQFAKMPKSKSCHRQADTSEDFLDFQELNIVESQSSVAPDSTDSYFYVPEYRYGAQNHVDSSNILPYMLCQATFTYTPRDEDELELSPGDIVYVTETFDDGWFVGISQRTNTYGTFPGNYVQKVRLHHMEPGIL